MNPLRHMAVAECPQGGVAGRIRLGCGLDLVSGNSLSLWEDFHFRGCQDWEQVPPTSLHSLPLAFHPCLSRFREPAGLLLYSFSPALRLCSVAERIYCDSNDAIICDLSEFLICEL